MKKWVLSALAYLIVVVGSYYAYTSITNPPSDRRRAAFKYGTA